MNNTNSTSAVIAACIENTKRLVPGYFESTLEQRLPGGAGSIFAELDGRVVSDIASLEDAIRNADWSEYADCPNLMDGCHAYRTSCKGRYGIVELADLRDDVELTLDDRKNTGVVSATVRGQLGREVGFAVLIVGPEQGEDVVFTVHPGDPVMPSKVSATDRHHGEIINVKTAKALGLTTAKIVA